MYSFTNIMYLGETNLIERTFNHKNNYSSERKLHYFGSSFAFEHCIPQRKINELRKVLR